jgi:DNA-binding protein Fis
MDQSGTEMIKKVREMNSDLPLIVLSKNPVYQERESKEKNYKVVPPPFQMEKIASLVKEALSSESDKQNVLLGSKRLSSQDKRRIGVGGDPDRSSENPHSANQDYYHIFDQVLNPIFDQIIRDCRGHIYDRLLSGLEKTMISEVLKHVNHNQVKASQLLGISRNTLRERMKRYDIF